MHFFYKQPVYNQPALRWRIAKQLSLSNNKNYRLKKYGATINQLWTPKTSKITFFISNTFISNARLKLAKNQANAKQHWAWAFAIRNCLHSSFTSSSSNNRTYSEKSKKVSVCIHAINTMMLICIKQQLDNIWSSIHEKVTATLRLSWKKILLI